MKMTYDTISCVRACVRGRSGVRTQDTMMPPHAETRETLRHQRTLETVPPARKGPLKRFKCK